MPTNPDEMKEKSETPVVGSIEQLTNTPTQPLPTLKAQADLSGFNSCFKCGREKGGRVTLIEKDGELICNHCI